MVKKNSDLEFESFLNSESALYLSNLQKMHLLDNADLENSWKKYFQELNSSQNIEIDWTESPSWTKANWPPSPNDEFISAMDGMWQLPCSLQIACRRNSAAPLLPRPRRRPVHPPPRTPAAAEALEAAALQTRAVAAKAA